MDKDALLALTCLNQEIMLFDFGNVLVLRNYKEYEKVRIISGGTIFHGEFVGKGMLTAAIQGEKDEPVASKIILRTFRELSLNHLKGLMVILQATSSDLLNFGLATECALNDNLRIKFLTISDDCKNEEYVKIRRRGLSGVILVNKIAGAMTEQDKSLTDIYNFCEEVVKNISSNAVRSGRSLNTDCKHCATCMNSAQPEIKRFKLGEDEDDEKTEISNTLSPILDNLKLVAEDSVVILLNKVKAINKMDEFSLVKDIVNFLTQFSIKIRKFYIGFYLKLPDENIQFTITILKVFNKIVLEYLESPCSAMAWNSVNQSHNLNFEDCIAPANLKRKERLAPPIRGPKLSEKLANILLLSLQFACDAIISCENQLNIIDTEKGDGDTGTRLKKVAEILLKRMKSNKVITNYPFTFFEGLSKVLEKAVGGTLGCIYAIIFEAAANKFGEYNENDEIAPYMWLEALEMACDALKRYGNVEYGDRTMYDPLYKCYLKTKECLDVGENFIEAFGKGVGSAQESACRTRAPNNKQPDSGAHAVGIWLRAAYEAVKLRC